MSQWSRAPSCSTVLVDVRAGLRVLGRVYGWVYWEGNTGYRGVLPSHRALGSTHPDQRSGPRKPRGGWSGWVWVGGTVPFACLPRCVRPGPYPPSGPGRPLQGLPGRDLGSSGKRARFRPQFYKVSQNRKVSSKSVNKACHSP